MVKKIDIEVGPLFSSTAREIRGLDGKDGLSPTEDELLALIEPLIPEPIEGPIGPIGPVGPTGKEGPIGPAGEVTQVEVDELEELIKKHIPKAKHGKDGKDFKFEDLTIEQKAQLEGPRGVPGMTGPAGASSTGTILVVDSPTYTVLDTDSYLYINAADNDIEIIFTDTYPMGKELTITLIDFTNTLTVTASGIIEGILEPVTNTFLTTYDFTVENECLVYHRLNDIYYLK